MDRRSFVRGFLGLAAATAAVTVLAPEAAEAAVLPVAKPDAPNSEAERIESDYRPDVDGLPSTENVQYYYRRRYRRRYYRPIYRRRMIYRRRPRYYRPRYYRPRRVYWF